MNSAREEPAPWEMFFTAGRLSHSTSQYRGGSHHFGDSTTAGCRQCMDVVGRGGFVEPVSTSVIEDDMQFRDC